MFRGMKLGATDVNKKKKPSTTDSKEPAGGTGIAPFFEQETENINQTRKVSYVSHMSGKQFEKDHRESQKKERLVIPLPAPRTQSNESGGRQHERARSSEGTAAASTSPSSTTQQTAHHDQQGKKIPLQKSTSSGSNSSEQGQSNSSDLDRKAAEEILNELSSGGRQTVTKANGVAKITTSQQQETQKASPSIDWTQVTQQQDFLQGDIDLKKKLFQQQKRQINDTQGPMLLQNRAVPEVSSSGADTFARENDAYRSDLSTLPDEMELSEEAYSNVPIEEFGDAMLRGMGATEEQLKKEDAERYVGAKRPARLGLGSDVNPLKLEEEEERARKKKYVKPGESREATSINKTYAESQKTAKKSEKSAKYSGKNSKFQVGAIVQFVTGERKDQIALITKAQGVPGLNKLEIRIVESSETKAKEDNHNNTKICRISKSEVCVLDETKNKEYRADIQILKDAEEQYQREEQQAQILQQKLQEERAQHSAKKDNEQVKQLRGVKQSKIDGRDKENGTSKKRSRSSDKHEDNSRSKSRKKKLSAKPVRPDKNWLREGIRVRVVKERLKDGVYYKRKGLVTYVEAPGIATIRMDCPDTGRIGKGVELKTVSQEWLETVVPREKDVPVMVVQGQAHFVGKKGRLLKRDSKREKIDAHLDNGEVGTFHFDEVAELYSSGTYV